MSQSYIITSKQLAESLGIHHALIQQYRCGRPHALLAGLPEPITTRPVLRWLKADIEAWLESRRTFRPAPAAPAEPPRRGPGRPRKVAAAEKGGAA